MNGSGTGCTFCVICRLSTVVGVVPRTRSCTALFRAARKSYAGRREVTHGGFDFIWNKPGIFLMEEVQGVIGTVGQCKTYPEPVVPISVVGLNKGRDFLIENTVPGAALRFPSCSQRRAEWISLAAESESNSVHLFGESWPLKQAWSALPIAQWIPAYLIPCFWVECFIVGFLWWSKLKRCSSEMTKFLWPCFNRQNAIAIKRGNHGR